MYNSGYKTPSSTASSTYNKVVVEAHRTNVYEGTETHWRDKITLTLTYRTSDDTVIDDNS